MLPCQKIELCIDPLIRRTASPVALAGHVFGTLSQIRTERITAFETADFTNLSNRASYFIENDKYYKGFLIMTTIISTRPSITVPFFVDSLPAEQRDAIKALHISREDIKITMSEDGLTKTFITAMSIEEYCLLEKPEWARTRIAYNSEHGIIVEVS